MEPRMHIRSIRLRIPGANAEAGKSFARQFANELAAHAGSLPPSHVGVLRLRIQDNNRSPSAAAHAVTARVRSSGNRHA